MTSGLPKIAPMAAIAPASIMIVRTGLVGSRKATAPSAVPIAMRGASGPSTAPKQRLPIAAMTTEVTSRGPMSMPRPCSGEWPACPGSLDAPKTMSPPTISRAIASQPGGSS